MWEDFFHRCFFCMSVVDLFFQVDAYSILFSILHWAYWIWKVALLLLQILHCCNNMEGVGQEKHHTISVITVLLFLSGNKVLCACYLWKKEQFLLEETHSLLAETGKRNKQKYFSVSINKIHKDHQNRKGLLRDVLAWRRYRLTNEVMQEEQSQLEVVIKGLLLWFGYCTIPLVTLFSAFVWYSAF